MIAEELKPCPFCGGKPTLTKWPGKCGDSNTWSLGCLACGIETNQVSNEEKAQIITIWNRRCQRLTEIILKVGAKHPYLLWLRTS